MDQMGFFLNISNADEKQYFLWNKTAVFLQSQISLSFGSDWAQSSATILVRQLVTDWQKVKDPIKHSVQQYCEPAAFGEPWSQYFTDLTPTLQRRNMECHGMFCRWCRYTADICESCQYKGDPTFWPPDV